MSYMDAGLIMQKSLIAKKLGNENQDGVVLILYLFLNIILNQKMVMTLRYHLQPSFIGKKCKYLHC